jgi:hypothetical protein
MRFSAQSELRMVPGDNIVSIHNSRSSSFQASAAGFLSESRRVSAQGARSLRARPDFGASFHLHSCDAVAMGVRRDATQRDE